jgi:hypothetical protein
MVIRLPVTSQGSISNKDLSYGTRLSAGSMIGRLDENHNLIPDY